jgi:ribosome-associated protein
MADPILVEGKVVIPAEAIEMRAVRSSGPGGQNVNKVASKVELRVDLNRIRGIDSESRRRLQLLVANRLDGSGRLLVISQRTRDQYRNLADARKKVYDWVARSLRSPKKRLASAPSRATKERRLREKKLISRRKADRKGKRNGPESLGDDF